MSNITTVQYDTSRIIRDNSHTPQTNNRYTTPSSFKPQNYEPLTETTMKQPASSYRAGPPLQIFDWIPPPQTIPTPTEIIIQRLREFDETKRYLLDERRKMVTTRSDINAALDRLDMSLAKGRVRHFFLFFKYPAAIIPTSLPALSIFT